MKAILRLSRGGDDQDMVLEFKPGWKSKIFKVVDSLHEMARAGITIDQALFLPGDFFNAYEFEDLWMCDDEDTDAVESGHLAVFSDSRWDNDSLDLGAEEGMCWLALHASSTHDKLRFSLTCCPRDSQFVPEDALSSQVLELKLSEAPE